MSTVTVTLPQAAAAAPSSATLSGVLSAPAADAATATATAAAAAAASASANPLLQPWQGAHGGFPAWPAYQPAHFLPALTAACAEHIAELTALAAAPSTPTFENTVLAFDGSGRALERVSRVLQHLCSSATSPELQAVELASAPLLAEHSSRVHMGIPGLFARVAAVHAARAALPPQAARLVERVHLAFVRSGAQLDAAAQARLAEVMSALALAHTQFSQNVLKDEAECTLTATAEELEGCPPDLLAAAAAVGAERGAPAGALVLSLSRSQVEPILTYATRRDTRERLWRQWTQRGQLTPSRDNAHVIKRILLLRCEQAALHGYPSFGAYQTADSMAQSPEKVMELLDTVWPRARASAERERAALEAFAHSTGVALEGGLQPWDWRFLAERERGAKFSFDEAALKPYLSLEKVTGALFDVAGRLFGLRFVRTALQGYHPDVVVYEYNNNNFQRGSPCLLTFDDAVTAFHEFGHGLHGLLSTAEFEGLAGTSVLKDFVELPSQLFEHWLSQPQVLRAHARHVGTGEPLPEPLLASLKAAQKYGLGFATVEYTACALLDQALHAMTREETEGLDVGAFEAQTLARLGMPQGIILRHRPVHFDHLFGGSGYAAGYYVYLWAEVLDADAFEAFMETGDCFSPAVAEKARRCIYGAGNTREPGELFREFRGRDPNIEAMLKKKGLV